MKQTIMCAECTREFEWEGGTGKGRKPLRCAKCRDGNGHIRKTATPSSRTAVARVAPAAAPVRQLPIAPADASAFAATIRAEVNEAQRALGVRLRLLAVLDEYLQLGEAGR
jgi:hypothetical protein